MAIIVDKVQKRKDIALSCKELFFQHGINDLTISKVAKTAGVGKGTIYDYFTNKEDIVFEIINILMQEHNGIKEKKISQASSAKEKVTLFFEFFYSKEDIELRQLYKEFISISLNNPSERMTHFHFECNRNYYKWFESIIQEGIDKKELKKEAINLAHGMYSAGDGIFINSVMSDNTKHLEHEINQYLDAIFELIEVKHGEE